MSMLKCRKVITYVSFPPPYVISLHCLVNDKMSYIKHYTSASTADFLPYYVAKRHLKNGKPQDLHITIPGEGVFEIGNQTYLAGYYCFYHDLNNKLKYKRITKQDMVYIFNNIHNTSYRSCLIALNKHNV